MIQVRDCRHGRLMFFDNDQYIGRSLEVYGEYSEGEIALWKQLVKPGMIALDIGANIGAHTVWLSKRVGKQGRVIAFEPQRALYHVVNGNLALNGIENTFVVNGAVGELPKEALERGAVAMINCPALDYTSKENFGGLSMEMNRPGELVPLTSIDLVHRAQFQDKPIHFMKIDVEGMELAAIKGGREVIEKYRPIIYCENDRADRSRELIATLMALGFRLWWHLPALFNENNYRGVTENVFGRIVAVNMLCVHASINLNIVGLKEINSPDDTSGVDLTPYSAIEKKPAA